MHPKCPKWLNDILSASDLIQGAVKDRTLAEYEREALLRSAIERNFEIIGEALGRIRKTDPLTAQSIPECHAIVSFRNLLIHGYELIDNAKVWQIIQTDLPILRQRVLDLLREAGPPPQAE